MGCNVREKSLRGGRKPRHAAKHPPPPLSSSLDSSAAASAAKIAAPSIPLSPSSSSTSSSSSSCSSATAYPTPPPLPLPLPLPSDRSTTGPSSPYDDAGWGYCTEDQLEDLLLKNLESVYKEALSRLVSLGYDEALALRAILRNGHCYGSMDVLSNILHNAVAYLNSAPPATAAEQAHPEAAAFSDLRHLEEYSLAGMVCLLQQVRPTLTRGDAMWCLLMADLHVGRASTIEIPPLAPNPNPSLAAGNPAAADFGLCKFHTSAADGGAEAARRFNLPPSMKFLLKRNGTASHLGLRPMAAPSTSLLDSQSVGDDTEAAKDDAQDSDVVAAVLKSLESMSIQEDNGSGSESVESNSNGGGVPEDHKKEMMLDLIRQIRELEVQVKERKEWAHQKAMQAARKLSNDLAELKVLRMEREENQRVKKGKQTLEDSTMKQLSEMEVALRRASGQVDRVNAEVRRLETENAEIRAEMEASKLSAAESVTACLEVARREKRCLKRLLAWEKQREKLQEEVAEERRKIVQLQQQLDEVKEAQKRTEVKWKQEVKAKEHAISQVEEERRGKEAAEASIKRKHEALRHTIELDFQRHKDDVQRLEDELSRLKALSEHNTPSSALNSGVTDATKPQKEANAKVSLGSNKSQESSQKAIRSRECMICMKDEVSVVLLPCAHQVLCTACNEEQEKRAKASCPCCNVRVEQRIRVYGARS